LARPWMQTALQRLPIPKPARRESAAHSDRPALRRPRSSAPPAPASPPGAAGRSTECWSR